MIIIKADIVLKKELLKGNPGGYYVPGVDDEYNLTFTPTMDDMPQVESTNIKTITLESFLQTEEYKSIIEAENTRKAAEKDRAAAESKRINTEGNRAAAEAQRATAEASRATEETERAAAELGRQQAEQARETTFAAHMADWESDVNTAVNKGLNGEAARAETFTNAMAGWNDDVDSTIDNANAVVAAAVADAEAATQAATDAVNTLLNNAHATAIVEENTAAVVNVNDAAATFAVNAISHITATQEGSGDASPDNIRPIGGWDTATISRTGKNLINIPEITTTRYGVDITASGNHIVMNGTSTAEVAGIATLHTQPIKAGNYMLSGNVKGNFNAVNGTSTVIVRASRDRGSTIDVVEVRLAHNTVSQIPLSVSYDGYMTVSVMLAKDSAVYNAYTMDIQLEAGDAATAIELPAAQVTLTAELPETVYGGNLEWNTGVLTITYAQKAFNGTEYWRSTTGAANQPNFFFYAVSNINNSGNSNNVKCSHLKSNWEGTWTGIDYTIGMYDAQIRLRYNTANGDVEVWKAYLSAQNAAGTPVTVVYPVTPQTIQLTAQQLETLKGINTVWSDCGETTLAYIADTKIYIDNKFNDLQNAIISLGSNV